jgi:phage tail-like protein
MSDTGKKEGSFWPLPRFYFEVEWANITFAVQEITGLDSKTQPIEYRHSNAPIFAPIKMPGISRVQDVVIKKGIFVKDDRFYKWYSQIKMNTIERQTVTVKLLDESGAMAMKWELSNAWPTQISGPDLNSTASEVAIESIEIAYETMTLKVASDS